MNDAAEMTTFAPPVDQGGSPVEALVREVLGGPPPWRQLWRRLDYNWTAYVTRLVVGERVMSPRLVLFRCEGCHAIRTTRRVAQGMCKCGSGRMSNMTGKVGPLKAIYWLVRGY